MACDDRRVTDTYVPGVCNIGPAEIRRRRATGIAGSGAAVAVLAAALATGAPRPLRAVVAVPAAAGASGFLQAAAHFCFGFGMRGVFNLGALGGAESIEDREARREDRARALALLRASAAIGAAAAAFALALP